MTINTKKTECIFFGNKSHLKLFDNKTVKYMGIPLERKEKVKYLGVLFDENMQWHYHIENVRQKVNLKFSKIKSIAPCLTQFTKELLINALVMPHFHYCSPVWTSAAQFRLSKLDKKFQAIKTFPGKESSFSINELFHKNDTILVFKALSQLAPDYMCSKFSLAKNSHSHNTRGASKNNVTLPMVASKFGKNLFNFRAAKIWNHLPNHVTEERSLLKFKSSISEHLGKF